MPDAAGWTLTEACAHLAARDEVLGRLIARSLPEQRHQAEQDRFHSLCAAVVSQQLSGKAAATILRRLVEAAGVDGLLRPETVIACEHETLRAVGLSNQKARYVRGIAEAVVGGELDFAGLDELPDDEVVATLTRLKGVGAWTAEMFLLFTLGRPDVLSVGDLGIRSAVRRHYGLDHLPEPAVLRTLAEGWHPYCSAAMLLLWHSLDNAPEIEATASARPA